MIKFVFLYLFIIINSSNIFNITEYYSSGKFKNVILNNDFFYINTNESMYKSYISKGIPINSISLKFSEKSSIINIINLDIFIVACSPDYFLRIIDSNLNIIDGFNESNLQIEYKCNLLYYIENNEHYLILSYINKETVYFYTFNINESSKNLYNKQSMSVTITYPHEPYFDLFKIKNNFYSSFLIKNESNLNDPNSNDYNSYNFTYVIHKSEQFFNFNTNQNISLYNYYPIGIFEFNDTGIFYGIELKNNNNNNILFYIPDFENDNVNFSIEYDGYIKDYTAYKIIKAIYLNENHCILNYLYKENIIKVKIIEISNKKEIFNFIIESSNRYEIKTYFNSIIQDNIFSYLISTENNKYYFIISSL